MIRLFPNEQFKEIDIDAKLKFRYAISNKGRFVSFTDKIENGTLLTGSRTDGYRIFRYKVKEGDQIKHKHLFFYKLVGKYFLPKTEEQTHVLHLDYVRDNDNVLNLRWATYAEMREHGNRSPHVQQARKNLQEHNLKLDGTKLTITKVMHLKKILQDPTRTTRMKILAKQFGVSETQIKRIATGENWGYIKV